MKRKKKAAKAGMTNESVGVNYKELDPLKCNAQVVAATTDRNIERFGFSVVPWTRGESAFLIETPLGYLGFVVEGLGTKSLAADAYRVAKEATAGTGKARTFYENVAQCNTAMAINDLITLGALPLVYGQYLAVQDSSWCNDKQRQADLLAGTKKACDLAGCVYGPGETPALNGIIVPGTADLAGATIGIIQKKEWLINPKNIRHGDAIILIGSSGIHANGLTMARKIAGKLPHGYLTEIPGGMSYGEALLQPTFIYAELIEKCQKAGIKIHYAVNITGHGWRKLMRAKQKFTYRIRTVPKPQPIFDVMQEFGPMSAYEAYESLNMGAGFALYVRQKDIGRVLTIAWRLGHTAGHCGDIENGPKRVIIEPVKTTEYPKGLIFKGNTLKIR